MSERADRRVVAVATSVLAVVVTMGEASAFTETAEPPTTTTTTTVATSTSTSVTPTVPATITLPAPAVVGQVAEVATRISQSSAAGRFEIAVTMSSSVTAVDAADGSYTTRSTIGTVDVPVGAELAGNGVNALVTRSFEQSFTATGAAAPQSSTIIDEASLTPEQQQSGRDLVDAISMLSVGFPLEPVEVGSAWTSPGTIGSHGTFIPVTYQCRLTALDASSYTMEVTYTQVFSQQSDAGAIEATIAGWGEVVGSFVNPLLITGTLSQSIDGIQGSQALNNDTTITLMATG